MSKARRAIGREVIDRLTKFSEALKNGDKISDKFTVRHVVLDLVPTAYSAGMVKETRGLLKASQVVFAKLLGVSPNTVRAWEQAANVPNDIACRFMDEIRHCPDYWRNRLRESLVQKDGAKKLATAK
jgi:putative transcriptional regulator